MKVEGRSVDDICIELGVSKRSVYVWFSDDLMRDEINTLLERVREVFTEKMAEAAMVGLTELVSAAKLPLSDETLNPQQKLDFLVELLDRTHYLRKDTPEPSTPGGIAEINIYNAVAQKSDDELVARAAELSGLIVPEQLPPHGDNGAGA